MAVTDFETKVAVIVRDDLAVWQRLNVCAFLMAGVTADAGGDAIGEPYEDADGSTYLPLLVQPVVVLEASAVELQRSRERAERREVPIAVYTMEMFATGGDEDNRAVVKVVPAQSSTWSASPCAHRTATPTRLSAASPATRDRAGRGPRSATSSRRGCGATARRRSAHSGTCSPRRASP